MGLRQVAIKIVDASKFKSIVEIERIQEEIRILTDLKHANIIHMKESLFVNDCFYFIMEYAEGGCLTSLLKHGAVSVRSRTHHPASLIPHPSHICCPSARLVFRLDRCMRRQVRCRWVACSCRQLGRAYHAHRVS